MDKTYIVLEMQTNGDTTAIVPPITYTELDKALQKFFQILTAAVVSNVEIHTAVIMTETGRVIRAEYFKHESEATE